MKSYVAEMKKTSTPSILYNCIYYSETWAHIFTVYPGVLSQKISISMIQTNIWEMKLIWYTQWNSNLI